MKKLFFLLIINLFPAQQSWTLAQCLDYAATAHPLVKQATVDIRKNDRRTAAARGMLLPAADAGISHNYGFGSSINQDSNQREAINTQYSQAYAQVSWELVNWRNYLTISLSGINKESSVYRMKQVQNEVSMNVIHAFFTYQNSRSWLEVLQSQVSGIEDQIARTEKEVAIGNRPKSDVYDIRANLGTMQEQWVSARNLRDLSKINLLNAMAITKDTLDFTLAEEPLDNPEFNSDSFARELLEKNPAYRSISKEIEARQKNTALARSAYLPVLNGSYTWSSFYNRILGQYTAPFRDQIGNNKNQQVAFSLTIPVFNRLQIKNNVEIAQLNVISGRYEKDIIINDLIKSISSIRTEFVNAREKYRLLEANFENQQLSFSKSEEKYREGLMEAYTFFIVRNNWLQARYNLISSKNEVLRQTELLKILKTER